MIYFIYGLDNFRSGEHLNSLVQFYKQGNPFYFSFDFSDEALPHMEVSEIAEILGSRNLFSNTRVIVLKNLLNSTSDNFQKDLLKILAADKIDGSKSAMLIIYENDKIKEAAVTKWLKGKSQTVKEFSLLKKNKLSQWVNDEAQKLKIKLDKEAKDILVDSFESATGVIYHTLKKLSLIPEKVIDKKTLEENIWLPFNSDIFKFLDLLAAKKIPAAFNFLIREMQKDDSQFHLLYLLKMIVFEFRNILIIKEAKAKSFSEVQKKTKIHPYTLSKIAPLAQEFSLSQLKQIYRKLLLCDNHIKRGTVGAELGLQMLLLDFQQVLAH